MKKTTILFAAIFFFIIKGYSQSFTATYTFDSVNTSSGITDPTAVPTATGVVFGSFNATGTPANPNSTGRFSFTNWATGATAGNNNYSSLIGSLDTTEYYSVTLSPAIGYTITLNDISFRLQRSGTGIRTTSVKSSIDNFTANITASINPANTKLSVQSNNVIFWNYDSITTGQDGSFITLGGSNFSNLTTPITFRFYGWNSEGSTGTFSIDNVVINGATTLSTSVNTNSQQALQIFPNPSTNGVININYPNNTNVDILIYDITGKIVYAKKIVQDNIQIDLSAQSNGIYFISILSNEANIIQKLIIQK